MRAHARRAARRGSAIPHRSV
eukprot:SAG31_NODE_36551_length_312_cov_0.938967_1_plen_20_part_01